MKNRTSQRKLKCLLVEDEEHEIRLITKLIENHDRLQFVKATTDSGEFSRIIGSEKIDIVFLDNKLGGAPHQRHQGLEFLKFLTNLSHSITIPYIISISQYPEDYQKALELNVWSVIAKPMDEDDFRIKVGRVIDVIDDKEKIKQYQESTNKNHLIPLGRIAIKEKGTSQKYRFIQLNDIVYIESGPKAHDITIHLSEPEGDYILTTDANFTTLEGFLRGIIKDNHNQLNSKQLQFFARIKNNCIINLCYINGIEANTIYLKDVNKTLNFINDDYRENIMKQYNEVLSN